MLSDVETSLSSCAGRRRQCRLRPAVYCKKKWRPLQSPFLLYVYSVNYFTNTFLPPWIKIPLVEFTTLRPFKS